MAEYTPDYMTNCPTGRAWTDLEPNRWYEYEVEVHGGMTTGHVVRIDERRALFVVPDSLGISLDILEVDHVGGLELLSSDGSESNDWDRQAARVKALYGLDQP